VIARIQNARQMASSRSIQSTLRVARNLSISSPVYITAADPIAFDYRYPDWDEGEYLNDSRGRHRPQSGHSHRRRFNPANAPAWRVEDLRAAGQCGWAGTADVRNLPIPQRSASSKTLETITYGKGVVKCPKPSRRRATLRGRPQALDTLLAQSNARSCSANQHRR
jgi:hypothetical protein